ncbi:MAG: hypothetical protein A2Z16_17475 [Chloroflexi bacterium RBG_16_54_18]|nr:MAG: hypothetical protein A2Z16_17475 [Chloroflexi bacterium RBG_16_54_18]
MISNLIRLSNYRYFLFMWVVREINLRYKQAFLGATWAILQPLVLTFIFTVIFSRFLKVPTDGIPYPLFSYTALLPWTFIASSITFGTSSLVNNMNLVTKVNVPREVLPIASVGGSLVDFAASSLVFIGLLFFYRVPIHATILWIPYLILVQICLAIGVTLLLSTLNVFYRDIRFAVPLAIQIWMYASPVIYPLSSVPEKLQPLYLLNPAAGLIESYRSVILRGEPPLPVYLIPMTLISIIFLVFSYLFFKRLEWRFADVI